MKIRNVWAELSVDEKAEFVREHLNAGSASYIASLIPGATRNAIIGCAHRSKIKLLGGPSIPGHGRPKESAPAKSETSTGGARQNSRQKPKPSTRTVPDVGRAKPDSSREERQQAVVARLRLVAPEPAPVIPGKDYRVNILQVTDRDCRAPQWSHSPNQPIENYMMCGKPVQPGSTSCSDCRQRFYYKPERHR